MNKSPPPSLEDYKPMLERIDPAGERPPPIRAMRTEGPRRRGPGRKPAARSPASRVLTGALYAGVALLCVVLMAATFLLIAAPTDIVRDQLVAQVKARTGRDLVLSGPASITFYPSIGIRLADVVLSAPPSMGGKPSISMAGLDVTVRLMPLLKREVIVQRLVLKSPVIDLRVDAQGRKSWDFAVAGQRPKGPAPWPYNRFAQASPRAGDGRAMPADLKDFVRNASDPSKAQHGAARGSLEGLELGDVHIENGTVHYADERSGVRQDITAIDVRLGLRTIGHPLEAKGSLVWKGERISLDGKVTSLKAVLEDKPAKVALNVRAQPVEAVYDGAVTMRDGFDAAGNVSAKTPSVRALAKWLGAELPPAQGYGPASIAGGLKASERQASIEGATLSLDGATATGAIAVDLSGARPAIKANLKLSELDLNKYAVPAGSRSVAPVAQDRAAPTVSGTPAAGSGGGATSIEDLLRQSDGPAPPAAKPGPQVRGFEQRAGWSDEPIDMQALGAVDADVKLALGRLLLKELKVGQAVLTVALKNRVMRVNFDEVQLYEGRGRGFVTIDGATGMPVIGANLQVEGIAAQALLKDAAGFESLSGRGKLSLALGGQGVSQQKIVETLTGKADLTFNDGAITGWNLAKIMRGIQQGRLAGIEKSAAEKTDFSELAATFNIANGIAQTKDLRMLSPLLRVSGAGNVMLPPRQIDLVVKPKLVASLSGQGGAPEGAGIEIPVKIHGSWDKPAIGPDVQGILKDPNQAAEAADKIGEQLGVKGVGNAVRNFLGQGGQGAQGGNQQKAKQFLDQFMKRQ